MITTTDHKLTRREIEVLNKVAEGLSSKEIAETLCITQETVKKHITHIYKKTGASNKIQVLRKVGLI
jgi:DNA-binding NarL/FixJ family response regulator